MGIPRKPSKFSNFFKDPFLYEVLLAVLAWLTAIYAVSVISVDKNQEKYIIGAIATLVLVVSCGKSFVSYGSRKNAKSTHELAGCLHILYAILGNAKDAKLRITIYVPVENDAKLEQVIDYIGDESNALAGRKIPANCGVIGKAFSEKKIVLGVRTSQDYDQFVGELVRNWNFLPKDAKKVNAATQAWFAMPLSRMLDGEEKVEGIIYLDSIETTYFSAVRQELISKAAVGIARFIGIRYG